MRLAAATLFTFLLYCFISPSIAISEVQLPRLGEPLDIKVPLSEERALGAQLMNQVARELPLLKDPLIVEYFNKMAAKLVNNSDTPNRTVQVHINDSPEINAMALPGGHIVINTGLILLAQQEGALASVVGHEIAHVQKRHGVRMQDQLKKTNLVSFASTIAAILVASQNVEAANALLYSGMGYQAQQFFNYSRRHERQADDSGHRMLVNAGYPPESMALMFTLMAQNSHDGIELSPEYLRTHPLTNARIADAEERGKRLTSQTDAKTKQHEYHLIRARVSALTRSPNQIQLNPDSENYYRALKSLLNNNPDIAEKSLRQISSQNQNWPLIAFARIDQHIQQGNKKTAESKLQQMIDLYPGNYSVVAIYTDWLIKENRLKKSVSVINHYLENNPNALAMAWKRGAEINGKANNTAQALAYGAENYAAIGNIEAAKQTLQQAIDAAKDTPLAYRLKQRMYSIGR